MGWIKVLEWGSDLLCLSLKNCQCQNLQTLGILCHLFDLTVILWQELCCASGLKIDFKFPCGLNKQWLCHLTWFFTLSATLEMWVMRDLSCRWYSILIFLANYYLKFKCYASFSFGRMWVYILIYWLKYIFCWDSGFVILVGESIWWFYLKVSWIIYRHSDAPHGMLLFVCRN